MPTHSRPYWLAWRIPNAVVETSVLHQDERAPHLHITLVPVDASGQYISWARVRPRLSGQAYDRKAHHIVLMKAALKDLHAHVSSQFGLERDRGNDRLPRERAIDRRQGELMRAAEGGYTAAYLAKARPEVKWADSGSCAGRLHLNWLG